MVLFQNMITKSSCLTKVTLLTMKGDRDWLEGIIFGFGNEQIMLTVNPDDDTIVITEVFDYLSEYTVIDSNELLPVPIIGKKILWAWQMINQRGYTDGIQIEFKDENETIGNYTIQFMAMASRLSVRTFLECSI